MNPSLAVAAAIAAFFLLGLVWPTVRTRRRIGRWPVTLHRAGTRVERLIGRGMGLVFLGLLAWGVLLPVAGPERLGVWAVPSFVPAAGWGLMVSGLFVLLVAQAQMGSAWRVGIDSEPTALVSSGLFSVVRNPVFTAMGAMLLGLALVTPSAWTVLGFLYGATLIALQTALEEEHLVRLHGEAWRTYASRVGRFVPGVGRISARA